MEERVRHVVVGHENVNEAVAVVIIETDSHSLAKFLGDAGLVGNVGEGAIPVIAIQRGREWLVKLRVAVGAQATPA